MVPLIRGSIYQDSMECITELFFRLQSWTYNQWTFYNFSVISYHKQNWSKLLYILVIAYAKCAPILRMTGCIRNFEHRKCTKGSFNRYITHLGGGGIDFCYGALSEYCVTGHYKGGGGV